MPTLSALVGLAGLIVAQTPTPPPEPLADSSPATGIRRIQTTISDTDAQFRERQSEVLDRGISAPPEAPPVALDDGLTGTDPTPPAPAMDLPDAIDSAAIPTGEVFFEDAPRDSEALLEMAEDTISVDFPNEDVRSIIRSVADLYELNVVIPDTLIGSVSLKLRDVSWQQVFDVVLEPLNFTWLEDGNIIKIKSIDDLLAEPVATRVFIINYATASEIQGSIAPMVNPAAGGRLQVDVRSNAIVITERPSRFNEIQAIIDRLDRPTDQVMIESKFVEVTRRDARNLGINWAALNGYEISAGPLQREYSNESSLSRSDQRRRTSGSTFDLNEGISLVENDLTDNLTDSLQSEGRIDTALFNADQFAVILSALENNNEVELVSNPTVVTMNNTLAQINIGEEFPIPEYRYNEERGTFEVAGFDYKPIGILLNVTPQVNSAGFINLAIRPEISSRTGEVNFGGAGGAAIPIVTTRRTESTVTIKSGYTLAIGGLMETQTGKTENKVPFLGDIPVLGRAFRSNTDTVDGRNLIIFITAKVLNPDGSTYRDVFDDRALNIMGINPRDIPGFTPPPAEQVLFEQLQAERERLEQLRSETGLKQQLMLIEQLQRRAEASEEKRIERELKKRK
jgi:type IV pilus assembly protein PilQ